LRQVAYHWWWRPGWHVGRRFYTVHVTFADAPVVQALAAKTRDRLAGLPDLDLIPEQWLHLTMQGIGFADEVSDADLSAIIAATQARLAAVPPVTVMIGPPVVASEGVTCWAAPPRALDPARDAVRAGIADTWGPDRVPEAAQWSAHVSLAYASADGPSEPIEAALRGLPDEAEVTIGSVDLIRLGRDRRVYEWETIASLSLSGSRDGRQAG
jgi:2'-5' RNA ligase superfamily